MAKLVDSKEAESFGIELEEIGRSIRSSFRIAAARSRRSSNICSAREEEDEYELKWAAIERLPTFERIRTSVLDHYSNGDGDGLHKERRVIDVAKLGALERRLLIENLIKHIDNDNLQLLQKQRERINRQVSSFSFTLCLYMHTISSVRHINIWMTLLLGPPGCGKTTLLLALAGKLDKFLKVTGEVSYNGFRLEEFVPEKTSVYISQYDLHIPEMTVREILDFSARFQGVGSRAGKILMCLLIASSHYHPNKSKQVIKLNVFISKEIMKEVIKREKQAGIIPEPDIDTYMKAISVEGLERSLQTDYILKIMGLDICADTIVGDAMRRGISGGQKKRLTTGEMIVGPTKVLLMDEISTGLDSSTTFQIVTCLQQLAHISESTVVVSLLQPAPETYDLFNDIILMAEGKIVYHGPRGHILNFFEECGFRCPERKGVADFLQEVLSRKDQEQYWFHLDKSYNYVSVDQFTQKFKAYHIGQSLHEELSKPYGKSQCHKNALSFSTYSLSKWEIFKACMAKELLLMKRNSFVYIFKTTQLAIIAIITMTVFLRTHMRGDLVHANYYMGSLFYALLLLMVNGFPELAMTVSRLPVFYKQRDFYFYPAWAYAIPACILKIPISLIESLLWTSLTYYVIGYSPEAMRQVFFRQFLILFLVHQMSLSLFRFLASYFQTFVASTISGTMSSIPGWLKWGFWISPLTYTEIGLTVNEFLAPRWQKQMSSANTTIGQQVLTSRGLNYNSYYYWISVGALLGYILLFNVAFTLALTFKRSIGVSRAIISRAKLSQLQRGGDIGNSTVLPNQSRKASQTSTVEPKRNGRMVLPFMPLTVTFQDVNYYVDTPLEMREQGYAERRLQLLHNITGAFRPGILSALMGVSGAGKTTLLDVLAGRKTGGHIEGDIRIGGYPKVQETFARISGYCEQTDIHSPQITVEESVIYSAWLRLPSQIDPRTRHEFVNEVLETIELDEIKDALVGIPGVNGLSTEQRKRLTIAVELVSNPSIIFMDEPTSGLDARAAAIVMRAVKNVAETGRTVVCTIHQPSIEIFEAFDEGINRVPRIKENYNPATWMLEVTSTSVEVQLGIDFARIYRESSLFKDNEEQVKQLSTPPPDSKDLNFPTHFPQNGWGQFKACLWKQYLSYWRSPSYNLVRTAFTVYASVEFAVLFWNHGKTMNVFSMGLFICTVLGKVKDFLGIMAKANEKLELDTKKNSCADYDIEVLNGNEKEYIEMDLLLGVADLHTADAVAAAESTIGGFRPTMNSVSGSSSEAEDDTDDDNDSGIEVATTCQLDKLKKSNPENDESLHKNKPNKRPKIVVLD
ncbi:Pleiotropic drug resistance protein 3 [Cocos nucifera]|uniref:Pleiotropic drug resistance protein 3 n=1 Tax=Cocos nucifera TaxID=13894 RepID=A0A8K0HTZ7_COCNU|nr:Pleiotropic drug resistance protein 3 [Cocos nucifera]